MDEDGLPMIGPGLDFTQVRAIHQKRTLAFINHFILNTVSFLNKFSRSCELRFEKFEAKVQKLEASLSILEAKLLSISGLENVVVANTVGQHLDDTLQADSTLSEMQNELQISAETAVASSIETVKEPTAAQDPVFARFFRMIQVGVPIQAVRLKMQAEGLDSTILDRPTAVIPTGILEDKSESESDSAVSSFSD